MTSARAVTRLLAVLSAGLCTGCAGLIDAPAQSPAAPRTPAGEPIDPSGAVGRIAIGRSTKAEVAAALGQAIVVAFDSGYEAWVYRWPGADGTTRSATELVVLFDPLGRAAKARVRPGYPPRR